MIYKNMSKKNTTVVESGEVSSLQSLVAERHALQKEILALDREIQQIQVQQEVKVTQRSKL